MVSASLTGLLVSGAGLFAVSTVGLLIPGSIFAYPHSIAASEPLTVLYGFEGGWLFVLAVFVLLCVCFVLALRAAAALRSRRASLGATAIAIALIALFVAIYPSSSQDLFHNIASARTLWLYGENPLVTPPAAHPDDPLVLQVRAWREVSSFYGPLFYGLSVIPSRLAGDDVLRNLLAFKALNGLALLALAILAGEAAEILAPGRRTEALVMVGWNPLLLYEAVANGHNDVLMMAAAVVGLLVATKGGRLAGVAMAGLSTAVKYSSAPLAPVVWIWSWKSGSRRRRFALATVAVGAVALGFGLALSFAGLIDAGRDAAVTRQPVRSLVALLDYGLQPVLGGGSLSAARVVCWAAFLIAFAVSVKRLDGSAQSLFHTSFWVMAALTLLTVRQIYPSYLIWFVCLGAILTGTTAWEVALLASLSGLLSNAVFTEWATWSAADDVMFMVAFVGLPVAHVVVRRWLLFRKFGHTSPESGDAVL